MSDALIAVVEAEINGGEYRPTGLRCNLDVDSFPSVSASIASAGSRTLQVPLSEDLIARMAKLQTQRLQGREEPDFSVTAKDGLGGEFEYEGFVSAPIVELTKVSTIDRISSVGKVALLDALDLSIYAAAYALARAESGNDLTPIKAAKNGEVQGVLKSITDTLVENYDAAAAAEHMEASRELLQIQHDINNAGPLELWNAILEASDVKYESWDKAFEASPAIARALTERTRDFLEAQNSGFWMQVQSLMSSFKMFYVPEFNGVGRFERADKKITDPGITLDISWAGIALDTGSTTLSATSVSLADGSSRILQPGGVVMMMRAVPGERAEAAGDPNIPRVMAFAPSPLQAGYIHREPPPFWLMRDEGIPLFGSELEEASILNGGRTVGSTVLDLGRRALSKVVGLEYRERIDTLSSGIMSELCAVVFKDIQLAQSTAVVTLPLTFNASKAVGRRMKIKIGGGGQFSGFISGVTHSVDLRQGKQLDSSTELRISHVDYR